MRSFNDRIRTKDSQGWSEYGAYVPDGSGWNNPLYPGVMTGLYIITSVPGSRTIRIGGVQGKGIVIGWGERGKYQILFDGPEEGRQYKSVYSRAGRFDLILYGELDAIRTIRCSEPTLFGSTKNLKQLTGLKAIELEGTGVKAEVDDYVDLELRELILTGTDVTGDIALLQNQSALEVLKLQNVTGLTGDIGVIASMPLLHAIDLKGCCGLVYTKQVLPESWAAPVIDLSDNALSTAEVDQFLNDLANAYVYDGRLNIAGSNAVHSAASDEALLMLEALRWEVNYNGAAPALPTFAITSFEFLMADNPVLTEDIVGLVTGSRIKVTLPNNTPVTALKPTVTVTAGATVVPASGVVQDFTYSLI